MAGVSFDRAAEYYDATRGLPDDIRDTLADILTTELAGRGQCLEIGVGTGRIAIPLHERGVSVLGADIAPAMLQRLVANCGGRRPFALMLADATRLPLASSSFGAVLASHVLHLIRDWTAAIDEGVRVLRPDGVLLVDFGGTTAAPWNAASEKLFHHHGVHHVRPGVSSRDAVADHLGGRAPVRALPPVAMTVRRSLSQDLRDWESQIQAWTWPFSPGQMRAACVDIRAWASEQRWPLDEEIILDRVIQWWAFERGS